MWHFSTHYGKGSPLGPRFGVRRRWRSSSDGALELAMIVFMLHLFSQDASEMVREVMETVTTGRAKRSTAGNK